MSEPQWLIVRPESVETTQKSQTVDGVKVNLYLAPHQIPHAVRGSYNPKIRRFIIEFGYLESGEPYKISTSSDEVISIEVGTLTKRILRILVNVHKISAQGVALQINVMEAAIKALRDNREKQADNSGFAAQIINSKREIFADLQHVG